MFDNTNPYTIRFEETDGRKRYFVAFTDGQGNFRETEVSKAVYMEFCGGRAIAVSPCAAAAREKAANCVQRNRNAVW